MSDNENFENLSSIDIENANIEAKQKIQFAKELAKKKRKQDIENYFHDAFVNKHGVAVWLISSLVWFFVSFFTFSFYTKKYTIEIIRACYEEQIAEELKLPLIDAKKEAAKIIDEAKKKAQKILDLAQTESEDSEKK